jgi:hypothetical protein
MLETTIDGGVDMRRTTVTISLVLASCVALSATAFAAAAPRSPSRTHAYRVVLTDSGDEYENAQIKPVNDTNGTKCPPSHDVPSVKAKCWTWKANHLGHGTYTQADLTFQVDRTTWTFTFKDSHGNTLTGNGLGAATMIDPTPQHTVGHVNQFPGTFRFTSGTGRFTGVTGELSGNFSTTVVAVDPATGIAHKKVTGTATGTLTFPSKL